MPIKGGVSLYSLQEDYYLGKLSLEDCIAKTANEIGVRGIEYCPSQMPLPTYPDYSEDDVKRWWSWMEKYKTVPTGWTAFMDYTLYPNRHLTEDECIKMVTEDLRQASRLGFTVYRAVIVRKEDIAIFEKCFPAAEHYGVQIALEIHAPNSVRSWITQEFLEAILRTGTQYGGFVPDFGIYSLGLNVPYMNRMIREGANESILTAINESWHAKKLLSEEDITAMGGGQLEMGARRMAQAGVYDDPQLLKEVLPYSKHAHGKFYYITDDYQEESLDYASPLNVMKAENWDGYIVSEFEGQRHYFDIGCDVYIDPVEQCRRQHIMIRNILDQ